MGGAIARRLHAQGFDLVLWNRDPTKASALGFGAVLENLPAVVAAADVIVTSLAGPRAFRAVYLGLTGDLKSARSHTFIDTSTVGPDAVLEVAQSLRALGSDLVDAPIAGVPSAVLNGSCLVLLSGDPARVRIARPVLEAIGQVEYVGGLGTASRLKLISNCMVAVVNVEAAELLKLARRNGLEATAVFNLLSRQAPGLEARRAHYLSAADMPNVFSLEEMLRDLDLAFQALGADKMLPVTSLVRGLVADAAKSKPTADLSALALPN